MKETVSAFDRAGQILEALPGGILLTTQADGQVNTMTIGWGTIGIEWGRPIFTVYVREGRHTRALLDKNPEFTINVPVDAAAKSILGYCGSHSGRDGDKIAALGLHLEPANKISVPGIRELPLTLECRVLYRQKQVLAEMPQDIRERFYPQEVPGSAPRANQDVHIAYYGEIVDAYLLR